MQPRVGLLLKFFVATLFTFQEIKIKKKKKKKKKKPTDSNTMIKRDQETMNKILKT
jgi:hypothetical protein